MLKNVLIIDDDSVLSEELAEILSEEGHNVETVLFRFETLCEFKPEKYDVIVLDFKMPDITGADILKVIPPSLSNQKVFLISGKPFLKEALDFAGLLHKVTEIIPKPFSIAELLQKIAAE